MSTIGLDVGTARTGAARLVAGVALPQAALPGLHLPQAAVQLAQWLQQQGCSVLVVGIPRDPHGAETPLASEIRMHVAEALAEWGRAGDSPAPALHWVDERYSTAATAAAGRSAGLNAKRQRPEVDSATAAALLQAWADRQS